MHVLGMAFLLPTVMFCCQRVKAGILPPDQGAGVLSHPAAWSFSWDAAVPTHRPGRADVPLPCAAHSVW